MRSGSGISVRSCDHRASIGNVVGGQHQLLAAVAEVLLVPGQLDDLHRLFEDLAVDAVVLGGHLVVAAGHDGAERPRLAGHRATADAELHPAAGDDVGDREVFGESQRMPLRHDVEHLPEAESLGQHRPGAVRTGSGWAGPRSPRTGSGARSATSCRSPASSAVLAQSTRFL